MRYRLAILLLIYLTQSINAQEYTSTWNETAICLDGQTVTWKGEPKYYNLASGVKYDIYNDSTNLYLRFLFPGNGKKQPVVVHGLRLRIKANTRPRVKAKIVIASDPETAMINGKRHSPQDSIPAGSPTGAFFQDSAQKHRHPMEDMHKRIPFNVTVTGFRMTEEVTELSESDTSDIVVATMRGEGDALVIMMIIPLREIFNDSYGLQDAANVKIKMKMEVERMQHPKAGNKGPGIGNRDAGMGSSQQPASGGGRNSGRMRSGGSRQGMHSQPGGGSETPLQSNRLKCSFKIQQPATRPSLPTGVSVMPSRSLMTTPARKQPKMGGM